MKAMVKPMTNVATPITSASFMPAILADGKWHYADGTVIPAIMGGDHGGPHGLTDEDLNDLDGGGGTDDAPDTLLPGQIVFGPTGESFVISSVKNGQAFIKAPGSDLDPSLAAIDVPLSGGTYSTIGGTAYEVGNGGQIQRARTLREGEYKRWFPWLFEDDDGDGGGGGGGGGGKGFVVTGSKAPDPLGALNFLLDKYATLIRNDQIPVDNAIQAFNAEAQKVQLQQSQAISQGQFQQTAEGMELDKQLEIERSQRARAEAATSRAMGIQQERGRRASDAQRLLQSSIPNATGMSLPLVGDLPLAQVNPDQFYDIQGLNNIPQIPQEVNPDLMGFDPTVPQLPQIPQLPNIPDQPVRPMEETIPPELIEQLLPQIIGGFPGFIVG